MSDDHVKWYRKILVEDPTSRIFVDLAEVLYSQGHFRQVIEVCRRGLELHPTSNRARVLLGLALWREGDPVRSEQELTSVQNELEKNAPIYQVLAEIHWRKGQPGRACKLMDIYLHLQPDDSFARATRHRWDEEIRNPPAFLEAATAQPEPTAVAQQPLEVTEPTTAAGLDPASMKEAAADTATEPTAPPAEPRELVAPAMAEDFPAVSEPAFPTAVEPAAPPLNAIGGTETMEPEAAPAPSEAVVAVVPAPASELDPVAMFAEWRTDPSRPEPPQQPLGPILDQDLRSRLKNLLATARVTR